MSVKPQMLKYISKDLPIHKDNKRIWIATFELERKNFFKNTKNL